MRLLTTLAGSMSVALENARLFSETRRLLSETEQRAAELAVINSVQQGLAAQLDFQGIIDLVGDKLREVLHTGDIGVRQFDHATGLVNFLYEYEHGQRLQFESRPAGAVTQRIWQSGQPVLVTDTADWNRTSGTVLMPGTDQSLSFVAVPIPGRVRVIGKWSVENHQRLNAFG